MCACGCCLQLSVGEIKRGFGAFYDSSCQVRGGSWAVYNFPGGQSCCRTCRWNKQDAVAAWLQPTELDDCPPCVQVRQKSCSAKVFAPVLHLVCWCRRVNHSRLNRVPWHVDCISLNFNQSMVIMGVGYPFSKQSKQRCTQAHSY